MAEEQERDFFHKYYVAPLLVTVVGGVLTAGAIALIVWLLSGEPAPTPNRVATASGTGRGPEPTSPTTKKNTQTQPPLVTKLTLTRDVQSPVHGQRVTITAHVTAEGATPRGEVAFSIGTEDPGRTVSLDEKGKAEFTAEWTRRATVKAVYRPEGNFQAGEAVNPAVEVAPAETEVTVLPPELNSADQTYTLRVKVAVKQPGAGELSGSVQFFRDGDRLTPNAPLNGGSAELAGIRLKAGQTITAEFVPSPDATHLRGHKSKAFEFR